jgi:hypothetical protein
MKNVSDHSDLPGELLTSFLVRGIQMLETPKLGLLIRLDRIEEDHRNLSQDIWCPSQDSNQPSAIYKSKALLLEPVYCCYNWPVAHIG